MIKADSYIELVDELRQPDLAGAHREFQCERAPVLGAHFLMSRGEVLATNYGDAEVGTVRATFSAGARIRAILWLVPKGTKASR